MKTTGDGLLLEFASVLDAVRCCIDVQQAVSEQANEIPEDRQMLLRVGINIGDIMIDGDDIHGEGVNIAARLEALALPGGIALSDDAYRQVRDRLDIAWEDFGEHEVKNIARPIQVWRWSGREQVSPARTQGDGKSFPLTGQLSIAVLPFDNMTGDPEQEYFSDGLSEDIITALSRIQTLSVIARNSSFTYKGQAVNVTQAAKELGARYVVEGSVRKAGERVRITVQLIDAESDAHLWAERYDRNIDDIFALQDEITLTIVGAIQPELSVAEKNRAHRNPPDNLDAWTLLYQGIWHTTVMTKESTQKAVGLIRQAIEVDPNFAHAYGRLAAFLHAQVVLRFTDRPEETIAEALAAGRRAIALDNNDAYNHFGIGRVFTISGELEAAINHFRTALDIDPSHAWSHHGLAFALCNSGCPEEAMQHSDMAIRLSRRDPGMWVFLLIKSRCLFQLQRFDEAIDVAQHSVQHPGAQTTNWLMLAAALAQAGRLAEAKSTIETIQAGDPEISIAWANKYTLWQQPEDLERYCNGLRKAGLPEN